MKNDYKKLVKEYSNLIKNHYNTENLELTLPQISNSKKSIMIFSPHPDDECIIGALPLMARFQCHRVYNVIITQGSNKARQAERLIEVTNACNYLGFEPVRLKENGLNNVNLKCRETDLQNWNSNIQEICNCFQKYQPEIILVPHAHDWNSSHIGTHHLILDAIQQINWSGLLFFTEYWGAMTNPNLMLEVSEEILAELMHALTFHVGEVSRNPYHLGLPAWMQDNVRRGAEIVGGQGMEAPKFLFATLYRLANMQNGNILNTDFKKIITKNDNLQLNLFNLN